MFPNPEDVLTSGQTVRVIIEEKGGDQVVMIPQSAVAIDQTGPYVLIVGQDDKVEKRRVRLGTDRKGLAVVEEGVKASGSWSRGNSVLGQELPLRLSWCRSRLANTSKAGIGRW